ncbi:DUF3386 domain-containing protein [Prochlorococcus sp. MIT 1223]|uniref:DUF3386 domain-containing protein n=1 Tax=Prochlorococcus sp. MIT 1223 TaxID=3096217 RepID=UPI002A75AF42|nr:DUF3386 domain-containing protein [Prochlorococcus sp. MIT 1223]
MTLTIRPIKGSNCRDEFQKAYENRYTWGNKFRGYKGFCSLRKGDLFIEGDFSLDRDLKIRVNGIKEDLVEKSIRSQLWEVSIHRVYRPFELIHGENTFTVGDFDEVGMEVIVGGKNEGDIYRIKNNIVTMVYRHIHSKLINIFTKEVTNTTNGYLSKKYTSQYLDPLTAKPYKEKNIFLDEFKALDHNGPWVLTSRTIESIVEDKPISDKQIFSFFDLEYLP